MSLSDTYDQAQAAQLEAQQRREEVGRCYRAVFIDGESTPYDRQTVWDDLEIFCGMRSNLMRAEFADTANIVGRFRVWQRIFAFCYPSRATESTPRDRPAPSMAHQPTPGGGIADRTTEE